MSIERFAWTAHALLRLQQRRLDRLEVECAIVSVWRAESPLD